MATMGQYTAETFVAGSDLSTARWKFLALAADGQVDIAAGDAVQCIGVALTNPDAAGKAVAVAIRGRVKVEAGGAITAGDEVVTNASGVAVEKSVSASATAITMGYALEDAATGQIFTIELIQGGNATSEV